MRRGMEEGREIRGVGSEGPREGNKVWEGGRQEEGKNI
jgi:hypothetical protein